jgi:hypothetical protein
VRLSRHRLSAPGSGTFAHTSGAARVSAAAITNEKAQWLPQVGDQRMPPIRLTLRAPTALLLALAGCGSATTKPTAERRSYRYPDNVQTAGRTKTAQATAAAVRPIISKLQAEADWSPYFEDAAGAGPGEVDGTETFCDRQAGRGWRCLGGAAIPSMQMCWIEEADVESREEIKVLFSTETELNPSASPLGSCRL